MPTDTSAPLPELDMPEGTTITVTCDDPAAQITQLVVHGDQTAGPDLVAVPLQGIYLQQSDANLTAGG
jgi:hypothetical protein